MLRKFEKFSIFADSIEEFYIGAQITFHDEYTGKKGKGRIYSFAQSGYDPLCWYHDDESGQLACVHLGWCTLVK